MVKTALLCYALVSYREARAELLAAQIAAMKVLHNRATLHHKPTCEELVKHNQFAWVKKYGAVIPKPIGKSDIDAWEQSKRTAKAMRLIDVKGITPSHVFFNHVSMGKRYKTKTKPVVIGKLIFY